MNTILKSCRLYSVVVILLLTKINVAENFDIQGFVKDSTTNELLIGAAVVVEETKQGTQTNEFGKFHFHDIEGGMYKIKISLLGYQSRVIAIKVKDNTSRLLIHLIPAAISLDEVTMQSDNPVSESMDPISNFDKQIRPTNSAQDLLQLVPGLFLSQHHGGGKAEQIFLRGFDCDHGTDFAVYLDGMPVNMVSHAHGQGYTDFHFVIPETIEKLSVSKGTYSGKYGDFATAGAGEFTTKKRLDKNILKIDYGMYDSYRALLMVNLLSKKQFENSKLSQTAYIATEYNFSNSYFEKPQNFNRYNIFTKYTAGIKERTYLNFSASYFYSKWDASGQIPERAIKDGSIGLYGSIDPTEGGKTSRANANLYIVSSLNDHSVMKSRFYYSNYTFNLFSNFTFFLNDSINGDQIFQNENGRNIFGYNSSIENNTMLGNKKLISVIGLSNRTDLSTIILGKSIKQSIYDTTVIGNLIQSNTSIYLDESLYLTKKLTLNGALRIEHFLFQFNNHQYDSLSGKKSLLKPLPKLNLAYRVNKNIQFFMKSGYGFHSNDARSVVRNDQINLNLPSALGYEVGTIFNPIKSMAVNIALWALHSQSELVYVGDGGFVEPSGKTKRMGADLGLRWQIAKPIFFDFDLNYNYGRMVDAKKGENYIALAPTLTCAGGMVYKSKTGIDAGLRYKYLADRPANSDYSLIAEGYFLTDAVLNYTTKKFQIGMSIENLFNKKWKQAQFETETRLQNEKNAVTEICFTPGTPRFLKGSISFYF